MQIILHKTAVQPAQVIGHGQHLCKIAFFQPFQFRLYLIAASLCLVVCDYLLFLAVVFLLAHMQFHRKFLIVFRHLFAQIAAARVYHQPVSAVTGLFQLDKMVAAAKGAKGTLDAF